MEQMQTNRPGNTGTFIVRVRCRQNATWQGEVAWAEKEKRQNFRSALELLKMIDGALDENEEENTSGDMDIEREGE